MNKQLTFYAPISKTDDEKRMVYGYASTEAVDSQGEIVKKGALSLALDDYMKYANIREMHQPSAVGKTKQASLDKKGLYIGAKIVDKAAWEKVKEGVYTGFSIGGRVDTMVDNEITALKLSEISLVDRPANPEAMFDVWKRDSSAPIESVGDLKNAIRAWSRTGSKATTKADIQAQAKELGREDLLPDDWKVEEPDTTKGAMDTIEIAQHVLCLENLLNKETAEGDAAVVSALTTAIQSLKGAAATEVMEDAADDLDQGGSQKEDLEEGDGMFYAEETKDLKKDDPKTEAPKDPSPNAITLENTEPVTEEAKEEEKTEVEPEKAETEETKEEEAVEEKVEQTDEEKLLAEVTETLNKFVMPTDEQIVAMLKFAGTEPNDKAIGVMKFQLAGTIVANLEKSRKEQYEKDAIVNKMEKVKSKTDKTAALVGNKEILTLVKTLEAQMKKNTDAETAAYDHNDVKALPDAQESPKSPAELISEAMRMLQVGIDKLNEQSTRSNLTDEEEEKLRDGVSAGSERTSKDRVLDQNKVNEREVNQPVTTFQTAQGTKDAVPPSRQMSEPAGDLAKLDAELQSLKEKLEKLERQPMPIKAKASYMTVNKFDGGETSTQKEDTLMAKINATAEALKTRPHDAALAKEAQDLQAEWQKLSREKNASNN